MLEEFEKFALRGNVVDLAIGVIIGAAFGLIVSSMVGDLIMPIIGAVTGGLDFSNYYLPLSSAVKTGLPLVEAKKAGAVLAYGNFITVALNFLIIAFVLFNAIQGINKMKKKEEAKPVEPSPSENCSLKSEIFSPGGLKVDLALFGSNTSRRWACVTTGSGVGDVLQ